MRMFPKISVYDQNHNDETLVNLHQNLCIWSEMDEEHEYDDYKIYHPI
jgi:hypothetical protein